MRRRTAVALAVAAFGLGLVVGRGVVPKTLPRPSDAPTPLPAALRASLPADRPAPRVDVLEGAPLEVRKIDLTGQYRNAFVVPSRSAFAMDLPGEGRVDVDSGVALLADDPLAVRGEITFRVVDRTPGHEGAVLYSRGLLAAETARDGWTDCRFSLRLSPAGASRLSFETEPAFRDLPETELRRLRAAWAYPRVRRAEGERRPNLVLVSLDTLRADHVGCYGYFRPTTPNLDRLARAGVRFEQAVTHAPWTLPSHMSLFTSLLPDTHGVTGPPPDESVAAGPVRMPVLPAERPTLAEVLQRADYTTAAFTGGDTLAASLGFGRGFDLYDERLGPLTGYGAARVGDWLTRHRRGPFFLFLHSFQIHAPYTGVAFRPSPPAGPREVNVAAYDGDIRRADRFLGMLLRRLRDLDLYDDTVLVVLSDHGEEFGDHDPGAIEDAHGHSLYDELLRVPLVVAHGRHPPFLAGRSIPEEVGLVDVVPTVLDMLGVALPAGTQGQSLLPLIQGRPGFQPRSLLGACTLKDAQKWSLRTRAYKYIFTAGPVSHGGDVALALRSPRHEELYDLRHDPAEKHDLCPAEPRRCAEWRRALAVSVASARQARGLAPEDSPLRPDVEGRLRSLGYLK